MRKPLYFIDAMTPKSRERPPSGTLAARIFDQRHKLRLSQEELGVVLGMEGKRGQNQVSRWELRHHARRQGIHGPKLGRRLGGESRPGGENVV